MSDLAIKTIRARLATALEAASGWNESVYAFEMFGRDVQQLLHQSFAVGVPSSAAHTSDGRQRLSEACYLEDQVQIAWAYGMRADNQVADYDLALDAEQVAVQTILAVSRADLHLVLTGMDRRTVPEGWVLGTITFRALHRYALE
tara:strand:- start:305 stop:739 length:435 start_codon:yes stop_codon:yes gene_type:complete